jgi:6-phosphofructokinase 1
MIQCGQFAMMASLRGERVEPVPIEEAVKELKTVPQTYFQMAKTFFG